MRDEPRAERQRYRALPDHLVGEVHAIGTLDVARLRQLHADTVSGSARGPLPMTLRALACQSVRAGSVVPTFRLVVAFAECCCWSFCDRLRQGVVRRRAARAQTYRLRVRVLQAGDA